MRGIIRNDFKTIVPLDEWQKQQGIPANRISQHVIMGVDNVMCGDDVILSGQLIRVFEGLRAKLGKPIRITSGYRSQTKQDQLRAGGYRAAVTSPHVRGYALDLAYDGETDMIRMLAILRDEPGIRIGWKEYRNAGQSFIHIDVAPLAYAVLADRSFPLAWRSPGLEW